jgi:hypothetical protein
MDCPERISLEGAKNHLKYNKINKKGKEAHKKVMIDLILAGSLIIIKINTKA